MTNQNDQNQNKVHTATKSTFDRSKLAFVGCENCSLNCCDGSKFVKANVLLNDLFDLAKLFPIIFQPTDNYEKIEMVLMLSIKKGVPCIYLDAGSKKCTIWGSVRPSSCRLYPFIRKIQITDDSRTHFTIGFDKYCEGVQESDEGIKIFTANGEISEEIYSNFFGHVPVDNYVKNLQETNKFLRLVKELGLLALEKIVIGKKITAGKGEYDVALKVLKISEKKLAALDADTVKRLRSAGYVDVINAHLSSLSHFRTLYQAVKVFDKSRQSINTLDFTFGR